MVRRWGIRYWPVMALLMGLIVGTGGPVSAAVGDVASAQSIGDQIPGAEVRNPQRIKGRFGHVLADNTPRTYRGPEPPPAVARELWWKWTAPADGQFVFDTHGSEFDTTLTIYAGSNPANMVEVAANDDDGDVATSALRIDAQRGESYHIRVDIDEDVPGMVDLSWREVEASSIEGPQTEGFQSLSFTDIPISINTGEKPQSKVWQHDGNWWAVLASTGVSPVGTWLWKLNDDGRWSNVLHLSPATDVRGDARRDGDVTHILLHGPSSELVSIQYVPGEDRYEFWGERASATPVSLPGSETATIDIDSTGRMWLAADAPPSVDVYHSDAPYESFSGPISLANNIDPDDIAAVTALPGQVGVLWSNQTTRRFGFRVRIDNSAPGTWGTDEVPAGSSALPVGGGMADDHVNVAVASDGTLYAAIKTEYEHPDHPVIGLLVRRPGGGWDPLHEVDRVGTRPIALVNEQDATVSVLYTSRTGMGDILMKTAPTNTVGFGNSVTVISGLYNNVTSTKENWTDEVLVLASSSGHARHAFVKRGSAPSDPEPDSEYFDAAQAIGTSTSWNNYTAFAGGADYTGDGRADLIARGKSGALYLFPGTGTGSLGSRRQIGSSTSWNNYTAFAGGADYDGDGRADLIARRESGALYLFAGRR
jgi:large repetitive protein